MRFYLYKLLGKEKSRKLMQEQVPRTRVGMIWDTERQKQPERKLDSHPQKKELAKGEDGGWLG